MNISQKIYELAGKPKLIFDMKGRCRICNDEASGILFAKWVKNTFTNFDLLYPGNIICQPCQFIFSEKSEILTKKVGKEKLQRMRTYSHFVNNNEWLVFGKDKKDKTRECLFGQKYIYNVVSDSGQKHLLFRARPGMWQFEEETILPDVKTTTVILNNVEILYSNGFSKTEIEFGNYNQRHIIDFGFMDWRKIENFLHEKRDTVYFKLAIFLSQKQEGYERIRECRIETSVSDMVGDTKGVQGSLFS